VVADDASGAADHGTGTAPDAADAAAGRPGMELARIPSADPTWPPRARGGDIGQKLAAYTPPASPIGQRNQLWRAPRKMLHRLSWGIADQGMSSLTNFAVGIYVIRALGAVEFGAFSIALVTYAFALNASRGLSTDPLMVRFSGADLPVWRRAVADSTGTALTVGIASGVCVLGAAAVLGGTIRLAFLALGLTLPGLLLQDSWRYSFFALGRGGQAFLNDTIWAVVLFPSLWLLRTTGHANVFWLTLAWGISASAGAAAGPLQARVLPRITRTRAWLISHRDLGPRYLAEGVSSAGAGQLRGYAIALFLGLAPLGYVQAATTITGPVAILFLGMALVTIPEAARVLRRSPRHLPLFCVLVSGGLAAGALAWGAFLYVAMPRGFGHLLIGHAWPETYSLVLPQTLYLIGQGAAGGAGTGMHALGAARRSLRTVLLGSALLLVCPVAGAIAHGAVGTVDGMAVAAWIGAGVSWWQLRVALREAGMKSAAVVLPPGFQGSRHRKPALSITPVSGERVVITVGIGEILADARRQAGLTIRQLSLRSGIPESVIWAIEQNDYSDLDDDYARSQIRAIARAVEANPVPLLEEYDADVAERAAPAGFGLKPPVTTLRRWVTWVAFSAGALLVVAGAVAYHHHI
jgi:O-antigen/teichoic acid export membrane protein/transcriptional regulator with XRE-family HTH domain